MPGQSQSLPRSESKWTCNESRMGSTLGAADPAMGTLKAAEARRLALQAGDVSALVTASWAQAAAAHARGELHQSVWADLRDTSQLPHLAVRVFDGQLCILQRFLYGARPYTEVIAFAAGLAAEALRIGAARGHAFGITLRGEAELLAGDLSAAEDHLALGGDAPAGLACGARRGARSHGSRTGRGRARGRLALCNGGGALPWRRPPDRCGALRAARGGFRFARS